MNVLVVGRPAWVRGYVLRLFREAGHAVVTAETPDEAVAALHAGEWDAVVAGLRLDEDAQRTLVVGVPRFFVEARVLMIRGTVAELLTSRHGPMPLRVEPITAREAYWHWGISA